MKNQKILIIEDETITALNLQNILEKKGYEVCDTGISAYEAVNLTEKHNPDLILLDIILDGEKDGVAAAVEIKKKHDVPIIYITAHSDEKTLQRAKETEPFGYIIKPISSEELISTIEIALYKHEMEKKQKEREKKYRSLYRDTPVMLHSIDKEGRLASVSDYWLHKMGYSYNEVLGRKSTDFLTEESRRFALQTVLPEYFKTGYCNDVPYRFVKKNGEIIDTLLSATAERDENGNIIQSLAVIIDITNQKKVEIERNLFYNSSIDLICTVDFNRIFRKVNPAWEKNFGWADAELIGKSYTGFIHPDDLERSKKTDEKHRATGKPIMSFQNRFRCKDGSYKWLSWNVNIFSDRQIMFCIARDITRRKRAEEEVEQKEEELQAAIEELETANEELTVSNEEYEAVNEELLETQDELIKTNKILLEKEENLLEWKNRYESAVKSSGHILYDWDSETNGVTYSGALEGILTYTVDEMAGGLARWIELIHPDDRAYFSKIVEQLIAEKKPAFLEYRVRKNDGSYIYVEDSGQFIEERGGKVTRMIGFVKDIDKKKKMEKLIQYRLEIEKLENEISIICLNTDAAEIDDAVNSVLGKIARTAGVNRCSLFIFSDDWETVTNTHEWCENPKDSQFALLQGIPFSSFGYYREELLQHRTIMISKIKDMPLEAKSEREWIEEYGFRALLFIPLLKQGCLHGAFGLYGEIGKEIAWTSELINMLKTVGNLILNILERKKSEKTMQVSEEQYRTLTQTAKDAVICLGNAGEITLWNKAAANMFGYPEDEVLGKGLHKIIVPERYRKDAFRGLGHFFKTGKGKLIEGTIEVNAMKKDGTEFLIELSISSMRINGKWCATGIIRDITERKKVEEKIKSSLNEKEILLTEIHHRVKNNMQVITSLLALQAGQIEDEKARESFEISENRIRSMALIHEQLYQSNDMTSINFEDYLNKLVKEIFISSNINSNNAKPIINSKDIYLGLDRAIPCGLIITELVSNALKHAFPEDKKGKIMIEIKKDKDYNYTLTVSDNGIGIPENVDIPNTESLGFTLLNALVKQLKGEMEVSGKKGTKVTITFPGDK